MLLGLRALGGGDLLPAVAAVAVLAALTRGLHLDGLADTADGLASYLPPERAREVMKAPDVGALGMVTVVLSLALQAAALAAAGPAGWEAVLLAAVVGRVAVTRRLHPGDAGGGDRRARRAGGRHRAARCAGSPGGRASPPWRRAGRGARGRRRRRGAGCGRLLRRHAVRRLGGVTGDVFGALVEVAATAALLVLALR